MADIELANVSQTLIEMQDVPEDQLIERKNQLKSMIQLEADIRLTQTTTIKLKKAAYKFHYLLNRPNCLVIVCEEGLISLLDLKTYKLIEKNASHRLSQLTSSAMSPDEKLIAVSGESSIEIFEFKVTGIHRLTEFKIISGHVKDIVFCDSDSFYSLSTDKVLKKWIISSKRNEHVMSFSNIPTKILYSSSHLYIADIQGSLHKFSCHFKIKSDSKQAHSAEITCLNLSKSEKLFASGSQDGTIKIWSFGLFEELQSFNLSDSITNLDFGINDIYLAATHDSSTHISLWKVGYDYDPITLEGHLDKIYDIYFTESSSCAVILTSSRDKSMKISPYMTNTRDAICLKNSTKEFYRYIYAFGDSKILTNLGSSVEIWNTDSSEGKQHRTKMLTNKYPGSSISVIFCEYIETKKILLVVGHYTIVKYDTLTWEYISANIDPAYQELKCCKVAIRKNIFLTGGSTGLINIRDLDTLEIKSYMQEDGDPIDYIDYLPNHNLLVSTTGKRIYLWNINLRICSKISKILDSEIYQLKASYNEKYVITLNDEVNLSFWSIGYYNYKWKLEHDRELLQKGSKDGRCKILNFILSNDNKYIYVAWNNQTVEIWTLQTRIKITYINLQQNYDFIQLDEKERYFYYGNIDGIRKVKNPVRLDYFYVHHPNYSVWKTAEYLNKIINHNIHTPYDEEMDHIFIAPYNVNIISIYAYFGIIEFLKKSLKRSFTVFEDVDGISPLNISIELKDIEVLEVILDKFVETVQANKFIAKLVEFCLIDLNRLGLECLPKLYDSIWRTSRNPKLSKFASRFQELPMVCLNENMNIIQQDFFSQNIQVEERGMLIIFKYSLVPFNLVTGSRDSFNFLMSLYDCPNPQIFKSSIIKELLQYKYSRCIAYLLFQTLIYFTYLFILTLVTYYTADSTNKFTKYTYVLIVLNTYLTVHELIQIIIIGNRYWNDPWNMIDVLRSILCFYFIYLSFEAAEVTEVTEFTEVTEVTEVTELTKVTQVTQVLLAVSFLSWLKGLSYFRLFKDLRYMINLIKQSFVDIKAFIVILAYTTIAFSLVQSILILERGRTTEPTEPGNEISKFNEALVKSIFEIYNLILGNISDDSKPDTLIEWIFVTMMIMIHPIIMLNLLISFLGATYSKVQEKNDIAEYQELTEIVMEVEQVLFWRRNRNTPKYFQMCIGKDQTEAESNTDLELLEKRVKAVKKHNQTLMKEFTDFREISLQKQIDIEKKIDTLADRILRGSKL